MKVCEIFPAVQGEGINMGKPTIFVRSSGCTLNCDFCDTKYHNSGVTMSVREIVERIKAMGIKHVTFTGGEPTMWATDIRSIQKVLKEDNEDDERYHFALETNGTNFIRNFYKTVCISPKKNEISKLIIIRHRDEPRVIFKFVYESKDDKWWENDIEMLNIPKSKVWIMPEGATRDEQLKRMPEVIDYCLEKGYNFSPRLHVLAFNDKRGV